MLPIDPIDLSSSAPFDPISYYAHLAIGTIGLLAALIALATRKGSGVHIWSGRVFIGAITIVAVTSFVLLATRFAPPLFVAAFTALYAVATAFLALQRGTPVVKRAEFALFAMELGILAIFLSIALPAVAAGRIPPIAPLVIAAIPVFLLAGDMHFFANAAKRPALRLRRHLARMIWALIVAVRAPLTELYADFPIPAPVLLFGPLITGPLLILAFRAKAGRFAGRAGQPVGSG